MTRAILLALALGGCTICVDCNRITVTGPIGAELHGVHRLFGEDDGR